MQQWSRQGESNTRPEPYEDPALPTELCRQNSNYRVPEVRKSDKPADAAPKSPIGTQAD
jgi:hypothetical protein